MDIVIYNHLDEPEKCELGGCKQPASHQVITLGDEICLCEKHYARLIQKWLELTDDWQERDENSRL